MVQGRIENSLEQTRNQQNKITSIITKLKALAEQRERKLLSIKTERKNIIESL
jgi:hypothetical protein